MPDDLFTSAGDERARAQAPLAARMRPTSLDEVVGQDHLVRPGSPLRRLVEGGDAVARPVSVLLWGPPGTGKTTLAHLVAEESGRSFVEVSAVNAGVAQVRAVIDEARRGLASGGSHRAVRRRGAPLLQDPAGRAAARGRERLGHPGRRDHREPALLGRSRRCCPARCCSRCGPLDDADVVGLLRAGADRPARPGRGRPRRRRGGAGAARPDGGRRRALGAHHARGGGRGGPVARRGGRSPWRTSSRPWTARRPATTGPATSTTTSRAR